MADPLLEGIDRPDRSGLLLWVGRSVAGLTVYAHELVPGAFAQRRIQQALATIRQRLPLMAVRADGARRFSLAGQPMVNLDGPDSG